MIAVERPSDLTNQVNAWFPDVITLARSADMSEIAAEVQKASTHLDATNFQVAFVGEFSRGKSLLINRLLSRDLLPVGALPTTATLTSIVAGRDESMEIVYSDGHRETRPLDEKAWQELVADDQPEQAEKVVERIRVTVNDAFLEELDAEIIDTPGINDLSSYRAAMVTEVLSQSDAAVMLISAIFPLSLTEAAFLEQEVLGKQIPRIIAVVSMLDTLPQDQKAEVFKIASARVSHLSSRIPVYPSYPVRENMTDEATLEEVRQEIAALVSRSDRRAWRSRQAAALLAHYLGQVAKAGQTALEAQKMSDTARAEALAQARRAEHMAELQWGKIAQDCEEHRLWIDASLREQLIKAQNALCDEASAELDKATDAKLWWERDFPSRMRQIFFQIAHDYEAWLLDCLAKEMEWLQAEVERVFNIDLRAPVFSPGKVAEVPLDVGDVRVADINQQRFLVRMGTSAAVIIGYLLLAPIGSAVSMVNNALQLGGAVIGSEAVNVAASPIFARKEQQQRMRLKREVRRTVERGVEEYISRISTRLSNLFEQVIQDLRKEQTIWLQSQKHMLESSGQTPDPVPWQHIISEATGLRTKVLAILAQ